MLVISGELEFKFPDFSHVLVILYFLYLLSGSMYITIKSLQVLTETIFHLALKTLIPKKISEKRFNLF